jgi:hypothetical protein
MGMEVCRYRSRGRYLHHWQEGRVAGADAVETDDFVTLNQVITKRTGGAVTQTTSRTAGVTVNAQSGAITLVSGAGSTTWQSFTVTNSAIVATDSVIINQKSGTDLYEVMVTNVSAGSFRVTYRTTGGTTTEQPVFNFCIIQGAVS